MCKKSLNCNNAFHNMPSVHNVYITTIEFHNRSLHAQELLMLITCQLDGSQSNTNTNFNLTIDNMGVFKLSYFD